MKKFALAAAAVAVVGLGAASANAAVVYDHKVQNQLFALDEGVFLHDFDGYTNPNVSYAGSNVQKAEDPIGDSAAPPWTGPGADPVCCELNSPNSYDADPTFYASVQGGQTGVFSALNGWFFTSFSFYMGSPDTYNSVTFKYVDGSPDTVLTGTQIWGGSPAGTGTRSLGYRVYYDFGDSRVSQIVFKSTNDAFEFDGLAGSVAVPEPATWTMMIMGFGAAGAMIRSRRRTVAA